MNTEVEHDVQEQEAFRLEMSGKIKEMIDSRIPLKEIAAMFGAEEFLSQEKRGREEAWRFNVEGYVDSLIAHNEYLKCPDNTFKVNEVFVPPDEGEIETGSGEGLEEKKIIPRSKYLMEILHELDEKYILGNGENDPNMMRSYSYQIFVIPGLEKAVLVNNEEGNATFVYHHDSEDIKNEENHKPFGEMSDEELIQFGKEFAEKYSKEDLKEMRDGVSTLIYPGGSDMWKEKVKELITNPISKKEEETSDLEYEIPSDGLPASEVIKLLGAKKSVVKTQFDVLRRRHPSLFIKDRGPWFALPEAIRMIAEYLDYKKKVPPAKEFPEWKTINAIRSLLPDYGVKYETILEIADRYRKSKPEWFKDLTARGRILKYLSPELVKIILSEITSKKEVPQGWIPVRDLAKELGQQRQNLNTFIRKIKREHRGKYENEYRKVKSKGAGRSYAIITGELERIVRERFAKK